MLKVAQNRPAAFALALGLSAMLAACGGGGTPSTGVTSVSVATVSTDNKLSVGETGTATANVVVTGTTAKTVTWTSTAPTIVEINATTGAYTAKAVGTATLRACSTVAGNTTKCGTINVTVEAAAVVRTTATINFAPTGTATPAGFSETNSGGEYTAASMTGWVTQDTAGTASPTPLNMTANTRSRVGAPNALPGRTPEEYTQVNMQCAQPPASVGGNACSSGTPTPGAFEYKVVNGAYSVTVNVGESVTTDFNAKMTLNVEGVNFVTDFVPTNAAPFSVVTKTVTVTDGKLTVDAKGGINTKIQYLKIAPAAAQ